MFASESVSLSIPGFLKKEKILHSGLREYTNSHTIYTDSLHTFNSVTFGLLSQIILTIFTSSKQNNWQLLTFDTSSKCSKL